MSELEAKLVESFYRYFQQHELLFRAYINTPEWRFLRKHKLLKEMRRFTDNQSRWLDEYIAARRRAV